MLLLLLQGRRQLLVLLVRLLPCRGGIAHRKLPNAGLVWVGGCERIVAIQVMLQQFLTGFARDLLALLLRGMRSGGDRSRRLAVGDLWRLPESGLIGRH